MTLAKRTRSHCYLVRILAADGMNVQAKPHQMRKLREPGEEDVERTDKPERKPKRTPEPVIVR